VSNCIDGVGFFEEEDVGGVRGRIGREAQGFVEAGGVWVFRAKAHAGEVSAGFGEERGHQRSADSLPAPCRSYVDAADAAYLRTTGKWIAVEAAHCNQQALIQVAQ